MSTRTRQRTPRRGPAGNPLVAGDSGVYAGPQGGAADGATVAGDLESREFGVPQADIPGGKTHIVNPQTRPSEPAIKPERPADYHKYHGVASDDGQYELPPDPTDDTARRPAPVPEPKFSDAVPVYMVAGPHHAETKRVTACDSITMPISGGEPQRIANKDLRRVTIQVLNEDQATDIRVGTRSDCIEGRGALITHFSNSYVELKQTQDDLYGISASATLTPRLSVIITTEIDER